MPRFVRGVTREEFRRVAPDLVPDKVFTFEGAKPFDWTTVAVDYAAIERRDIAYSMNEAFAEMRRIYNEQLTELARNLAQGLEETIYSIGAGNRLFAGHRRNAAIRNLARENLARERGQLEHGVILDEFSWPGDPQAYEIAEEIDRICLETSKVDCRPRIERRRVAGYDAKSNRIRSKRRHGNATFKRW